MTLANGRGYLAIPGPSVMPDRVLNAMHQAAPNIYEGALMDMVAGLVPDLCAVARTKGKVAIYIANGHGIWEAALSNVIAPGDRVLVLATGRFGKGWAEMALGLGAFADVMDFGLRSTIDLEQVQERLSADTKHSYKAVMAVHVDTGTSVRNDIQKLRETIDAANHPALLMVDCIASLGCDRFEMDAWGVDVMVSASQKGLMTPPGIGFVFFNDRAANVRSDMPRVSRYWDWVARSQPSEFWEYWDGTAPTHHLFGLRAALDMIAQEGIQAVWHRHQVLAEAYWAAFESWANEGGALEINIGDRALRSHAVSALRLPAPKATELRNWLVENTGVTLGIGLGMAERSDPAWHGFFRVGHMGHVNAHMVLGVVTAIQAGFDALDIPNGHGGPAAAAARIAQG